MGTWSKQESSKRYKKKKCKNKDGKGKKRISEKQRERERALMKQHKGIFSFGVRKNNRCRDKWSNCEKQGKENAHIQENKRKNQSHGDKIERK